MIIEEQPTVDDLKKIILFDKLNELKEKLEVYLVYKSDEEASNIKDIIYVIDIVNSIVEYIPYQDYLSFYNFIISNLVGNE